MCRRVHRKNVLNIVSNECTVLLRMFPATAENAIFQNCVIICQKSVFRTLFGKLMLFWKLNFFKANPRPHLRVPRPPDGSPARPPDGPPAHLRGPPADCRVRPLCSWRARSAGQTRRRWRRRCATARRRWWRHLDPTARRPLAAGSAASTGRRRLQRDTRRHRGSWRVDLNFNFKYSNIFLLAAYEPPEDIHD